MFGRKKVQKDQDIEVQASSSGLDESSELRSVSHQKDAGVQQAPVAGTQPEAQTKQRGDAAERRRMAAGAKLVSAAFGEIVTLLMRAPGYKHYTLADLEWLAVPPLLCNQFTLAEARSKETGLTAPVGIALWARVSEEVDHRLSSDLAAPIRLRPDEWQSGDILWLVDAVGPPKIVQALVQRLRQQDFNGQGFKLRARDPDGSPMVKEFPALAAIETKTEAS